MPIDTSAMNALLGRLEAAREAIAHASSGLQSTGAISGAGAATGSAAPVDFAAMLKDTLTRVNQSQATAMGTAERFQLGDPKVSLEETMVALSKANIDFQQMVQVRNRVVSAYHDIMNLQI